MLHITIIQVEYDVDVYYSSCFRRYFTVHVFCKICKKFVFERTLNTIGQCICLLSVWYVNFIYFEDPINFCLEIWSEVSRCLENDTN